MAEATLDQSHIGTVDEFLAWAENQPERWQFIDGVLVMMAGASDPHVFIQANVQGELYINLQGKPCRPHGSDRAVGIPPRNCYYPDVSVSCREPDGRFSPEPVLVVEILSPSSEADDRGRKRLNYQKLPGLRHYLVLAQDEPLAELWTRIEDGWHYAAFEGLDHTVRLEALSIALPLAAVYRDVVFPPAQQEPT